MGLYNNWQNDNGTLNTVIRPLLIENYYRKFKILQSVKLKESLPYRMKKIHKVKGCRKDNKKPSL